MASGEIENSVEVYTTFSKTWGDFDPRRVAYIGKKQIFDAWSEIFIKLDGNPSTLKILKVSFETNLSSDGILEQIQKLNGGRQRVFDEGRLGGIYTESKGGSKSKPDAADWVRMTEAEADLRVAAHEEWKASSPTK